MSSRNVSNNNSLRNYSPINVPVPILVPPTPTPLALPLLNTPTMQPSFYSQAGSLGDTNNSYDASSKSMMFGIPRDCPKPSLAHGQLLDHDTMQMSRQLCDISLNNPDEMSMYHQARHMADLSSYQSSMQNRKQQPFVDYPPKSILKNSAERPLLGSGSHNSSLNESHQHSFTTMTMATPSHLSKPTHPGMLSNQTAPLVANAATPQQPASPPTLLKQQPVLNQANSSSIKVFNSNVSTNCYQGGGSAAGYGDNQQSFLLDDFLDKNTSMNTKTLAMKYLKNLNTNLIESLFNPDQGASMVLGGSSNVSVFKHKPFQLYDTRSSAFSNPNTNNETIYSIAEEDRSMKFSLNNLPKLDNLYKPYNNKDLSSYTTLTTTSSASSSCNHQNNYQYKCYAAATRGSATINGDESGTSDDDDENGDCWVFGRPSEDNKRRSGDFKFPEKKAGAVIFGDKKTVSNGKPAKDFSDEDSDADRDVTTVLDIEKLKKLPKLL
jgi:hypothetical protein